MKYLSFIFALLIGFICLSSCSSTYYYSTLSSNDEGINRDNLGSFIFNTDTIQITYSFNGQDGPIQIGVLNKLDMPMYVDWSRSAIIINDVATSYKGQKSHITTETTSQTFSIGVFPYTDISTTKATTTGYEYNPEQVSFIPPKRKINHCSLWLSNLNFSNIDKKEYNNNVVLDAHNQTRSVKALDFSEDNTPLFFESYLTIFLEDGSTYAITQSFYIANLIRAKGIAPSNLEKGLAQRNDFMFTVIQANNSGWEALAIGGIIVGTTILDATLNSY